MRFIVVGMMLLLCGSGATASLPDVSAVTGCAINEQNVQNIYHVSLDGNDLNPGSQALPFRTINYAASKAGQKQVIGQGTKVIIHPGVYRETVDALMNYPTATSIGAPIIFEPAEPNSVTIAGSDVYTDWQAQGSADVYQHSWTYNWGLYLNIDDPNLGLAGYEKQVFVDYPILRRREMFFANGQLLKQVLSLSAMQSQQGSFYVDDAAKLVYVHLAAGTNINSTTIEAAIRMYCFRAYKNRNIVLRGLTFEHASNLIFGNGAVSFETCKDLLLENNTFNFNNGIGWSVKGSWVTGSTTTYYASERITVRRNVANYNGIAGAETLLTRNTVFEDNITSYNNWRGNMGTLTWGWTGTRFYRIHKAIIRRHTSYGNYARGIWLDYDAVNVVLEDSSLCNNADGLKFEVDEGPVLIRNCTISNNAATGILYHVSNNITVTGCRLVGNGSSQLFVDGGQVSRYLSDWENVYPSGYLNVGNLDFNHNVVGASGSQLLTDVTTYQYFLDTFKSDYNYWYHTTNATSFKAGSLYTFSGWKTYTHQDGNSVFASTAPVPTNCGDLGTVYSIADMNKDCTVNLGDLAQFATEWMRITTASGTDRTYVIEPLQDTYFSTDGNPNSASGGTATTFTNTIYLQTGRACSLFKFDLGALKAGQNILNAQYYVKANSYMNNGVTNVAGKVHGWKFHRMLAGWTEASTYNSLNQLRSGIEYDATPFATYIHDGNEGPGPKYIPGFESAISNWVNGTWSNNGFIIISYAPAGYATFNNVSFRSKDFTQWQNENPLLIIVAHDPAALCGDSGTISKSDLKSDCSIDLEDCTLLIQQWLAQSIN